MEKICTELAYARVALKKALGSGGDVTAARKRIGWLDERLERLLGKKRKRVSVRDSIYMYMYGYQ